MSPNIDISQTVNHAARTDIGKKRDNNEDCFLVNSDLGLYLVADGMGGHASGEVASEIAAKTIEQQVAQGNGLVGAIESAHLAILQGVRDGIGKRGMGTTVVALHLRGDAYTLAWVGDSRAYLWHDGLSQLSKDHSLVQMLLDSGQITQSEARTHPRKNVIFQNLGASEVKVPEVSVIQGVLYKDQKIILCSDGLSDEVDDAQINEVMTQADKVQADSEVIAVERLVSAAVDNGGNDNVTVVVISAGR